MFLQSHLSPQNMSFLAGIKIESHQFYLLTDWQWSKEKCFDKKYKMANLKKLRFSKPPILKIFSQTFQGLVFGWIEYFFQLHLQENYQNLYDRMDGTQFLWSLWFQAKNHQPHTFFGQSLVHSRLKPWIFKTLKFLSQLKNFFFRNVPKLSKQ